MVEAGFSSLEESQIDTPVFSDREITRVSEEYGTPVFLVDEGTLASRFDKLRGAYRSFAGNVFVAYSMKANFNPSILQVFLRNGALFDVTSLGELYFFTKSGGDITRIIYTSVTEEEHEFEKALREGVTRFVVGSYNGLVNLSSAVNELGVDINVLIRINPEVAVKAVVRAAYKNSKFGVPFSNGKWDSAPTLLKRIVTEPRMSFEGFHFHLGSQIEDASCYIAAIDRLEAFIERMKRYYPDLSVKIIDIGGGTPVFYGTPVPSPEEIGRIVSKRLNDLEERLEEKFTLIVESGRYLSTEASVLISRIVNTKIYADQKFVYLDAGFHLLLDSALLHQAYPQYVIPRSFGDDPVRVKLAGRLCDTYDVFPLSQVSDLRGAELGKLVVFQNVGAYSLVFGMPFHCQTKPAVFMRRTNGQIDLIRPAQTIDGLFNEEGGGCIQGCVDRRGSDSHG
jgi:diaminopimelate decarboxylase